VKNATGSEPNLKKYLGRMELEQKLRQALIRRGYQEVSTPILVPSPGTDLNLEAFATEYRPALDPSVPAGAFFLHTSPEFAMKRLLVQGLSAVFQITKVFRQGELSPLHQPEFTLAEWYRVGWSYQELMDEVEALTRELLGAALLYQGRRYELAEPFRRVSVAEALQEAAGVDLRAGPFSEERFFGLMVDKVDPWLAAQGPVFLYDYPAEQAILARKKSSDSRLAERFELFLAGLELGNGFSELCDPLEQRARFQADLEERRRRGLRLYPMPEAFLQALAQGLPECAGVALGVDRLAMLKTDSRDIREVLAFPFGQ